MLIILILKISRNVVCIYLNSNILVIAMVNYKIEYTNDYLREFAIYLNISFLYCHLLSHIGCLFNLDV